MGYYVYVCDGDYYFEMERYELYNFVREGNKGVFGNFPQQKRLRRVKSTYYLFVDWAHETKLIDYIAYDCDFNLIDYKVLEEWAYTNRNFSQFPSYRVRSLKDHKFRQEPVEGTAKIKWRYSQGCKCNFNLQRRRLAQDEDHKPFVTRKDKIIHDPWDEVPRGRRAYKSWKNKKVRKQYMKNL